MTSIRQQPSPLEALPIEIKTLIFERIPDVRSLPAAVLAGPGLYRAFKSDEGRISRSIIRRQIQEASMSDAIAAWAARSHTNKYWTVQQTRSFLRETEDRNTSFFKNINLAKVLRVTHLHSTVQHLTLGLIEHGVRNANINLGLRERWQDFTPQEVARTERAFYRFELYCIFFGDIQFKVVEKGQTQQEAFWHYFAPWEIEQIVSVAEYIQIALLPFIEKLAMTVPRWTSWLHHSTDFQSCLQSILFARLRPGLQYIRWYLDQSPMKEQSPLLPENRYAHNNNFIQECLDSATQDDEGRTLSDLESDPDIADTSAIIDTTRHNNGDSGPEEVWRWAYQNTVSRFEDEDRFGRGLARKSLRSCAYVFIDLERAQGWFPLDRNGQGSDAEDHPDSSCARHRKFCQMIDDEMNDWAVTGVPLD